MILHENGPGGVGGRSTRALSINKILPLNGLSVIDLGSNEGYNCFDFHELGCKNIVGIELRDRFLEEAEKERERLGYKITFQKKDVRKIDEVGLGKFDLCHCTGLLYHMRNPFDLLKRIRKICGTLVLETHVSPSFFTFYLAKKKYRCNLTLREQVVVLDGEEFRGRFNVFAQDTNMNNTSGSIDSYSTFWPNLPSLLKAVSLAGFKLKVVYFNEIPEGYPPIYVNYGYRRTKVFLIAEAVN